MSHTTILSKINPRSIAMECSPAHIENVIIKLVEELRIANKLAHSVLTLNEKSGELGEGKCLQLKALAEEFKMRVED